MYRASASEFPNDNPLLHDGAVWICTTPCGPLEVELEPRAGQRMVSTPPPPDDPLAEEAVFEDEPSDASASPPPESPDAFAAFVRALASIAYDEGGPRAAAMLSALLERGWADAELIDEATAAAVVAAGWAERSRDGLGASARLASLAGAWGDVLRGAGDFEACGESTLNEFGADLLAAVLGQPRRAEVLRDELRRHGIAAFGMLRLAA